MIKTINLKNELNYFKGLTKKLLNSPEQDSSKLTDLFDTIHDKAIKLSNSFNFNDGISPVNEVKGSGDYGDIESGANTLYYYCELIDEVNPDNLEKVHNIFKGGAKIKNYSYLYVNYAYDNPACVYEETPKRISAITNAIATDIEAYLNRP